MSKKKLLLTILFFYIFYCFFNIIIWYKDNFNSNKIIGSIDDIEINESNLDSILINPDVNKNSLYWKLINEKLINVNINKLKELNNDSVGYLKINYKNISYPILQTNNNTFYLDHSFDKSKNSAGWVFLDYRNDLNKLNYNTIIYAHNRKDETMFGKLKYFLNDNWVKNYKNHIIKISSEKENTMWQIFSVFYTKSDSYLISSDFENNNDFLKYINYSLNKSFIKLNVNINKNDKLLTLLTCYSNNEKLIVHAKLIKKEVRLQD